MGINGLRLSVNKYEAALGDGYIGKMALCAADILTLGAVIAMYTVRKV
jgi:hypothetical protein